MKTMPSDTASLIQEQNTNSRRLPRDSTTPARSPQPVTNTIPHGSASTTLWIPPDTDTVADTLAAARDAMEGISQYSQIEIDALVRGIGRVTYDDSHRLGELAVEETGIGNVSDKVTKIERTVLGALDDFGDVPSVGVIRDDHVIEVAKPVGVIAALTPSTNPVSTIAFLAMCAVKGGNAIVFSPSPSTTRCVRRLVNDIHAEFDSLGAPRDLVQLLPGAVTKQKTRALVEGADFVQVTGSRNNVEMGQTSGTPNYCVSEGNVVALVDESASLPETAHDILAGATLDYGALCTCENGVVVHRSVAAELERLLEREGGYFCSDEQTAALRATMFAGDGMLDRTIVARPAAEIASRAGFEVPDETRLLFVRPEAVGPGDPLSGEKLSVVVAFYEIPSFEAGVDLVNRILDFEGAGHSSILHTNDESRVEQFARDVNVCRAIVNQPSTALLGSYDNGLSHTVVLGGGPWAGNQLDENLTYTHFLTTTRVAKRTPRPKPRADRLLAR